MMPLFPTCVHGNKRTHGSQRANTNACKSGDNRTPTLELMSMSVQTVSRTPYLITTVGPCQEQDQTVHRTFYPILGNKKESREGNGGRG